MKCNVKKDPCKSDIQHGDFVFHDTTSEIYILCTVTFNECFLISLGTGDRWREPVKVKNHREITLAEWKEISKGGKFRYITRKEMAKYFTDITL